MIGILTGCATTETPDPFELPEFEREATTPLKSCVWPNFEVTEVDGEQVAYVDRDGFKQIQICEEVASTNEDIAAANAESYDGAANALETYEGMAQRQIELDEWKIEELQRDRLKAETENWVLKALIIIGIGASL